MLTTLRREYAQLITSGGQLLLLFVGFKLESYTGWLWCLGIMAVVSLFAWYSALHRLRAISGTPTSRIGSAAQGYTELIGHGEVYEAPVLSKYSRMPCLWCRHKLEVRNSDNKGWHTTEQGESSAPFLIDDGTGQCGSIHREPRYSPTTRTRGRPATTATPSGRCATSTHIYALGEFKTVGGSNTTLTHEELVKQVLSEWKIDNDNLLKRFDLQQRCWRCRNGCWHGRPPNAKPRNA